jgi:hypothetical protein
VTEPTTTEWRTEAVALMPVQMHPVIDWLASEIDQQVDWSGRNFLFPTMLVFVNEAEGVSRQRMLNGVSRLIELGWAAWEEWPDETELHLRIPEGFIFPESRRSRRPRQRRGISQSLRYRIYARDEWTCWLCGREVEPPSVDMDTSPWEPVLDHVVPHCDGGSDRAENLRTAHRWCNNARGERSAPDRYVMRAKVALMKAEMEMEAEEKAGLWPQVGPGEKPVELPVASQPVTRRRREATQISDDWRPSDKHVGMAYDLGLDLDHEHDQFRLNAMMRPRIWRDWDRAFSSWLRRHSEINNMVA